MRTTTTAAAADGAGEMVAAEAAVEATHGEADASGHRPSPEGGPGAAEEPITEVTSSKLYSVITVFVITVQFNVSLIIFFHYNSCLKSA
jgi:hypothetical protein